MGGAGKSGDAEVAAPTCHLSVREGNPKLDWRIIYVMNDANLAFAGLSLRAKSLRFGPIVNSIALSAEERCLSARILAIEEHLRKVDRRPARSIVESRLTSAVVAIDQGIISCGTAASITASILRSSGVPSLLVHGTLHGTIHAWIAAWDSSERRWRHYDAGREIRSTSSAYQVGRRCGDWSEIEDEVRALANTY